MKTVAIVPAAGVGRRFGHKRNKAFAELLGKPVVAWVIEALMDSELIDEIIPVFSNADMEQGMEMVKGYRKVTKVVPGGLKRQDSVNNALGMIEDPACMVLIHDAARPLLEESLIRRTIEALAGYDGVVAAVPPKDTIKVADAADVICDTLRRDELWAVQTPQVFLFTTLHSAYESASAERFYSTDDSALVERRGGRVRVVMGAYENLKITTPEDLLIAEALMGRRGAQ